MEPRLCKIYLHDLDLRQQARVRKQFIYAAKDHATNIRFVQDLNVANIWVLDKNSSFMDYAFKRKTNDSISLCIFSEESLLDSDKQPLSSDNTHQLISHILEHVQVKTKKQIACNVAKLIQQGMSSRQGDLCIGYKEAVFLFNFSSLQARYNDIAHDILWSDTPLHATLDDLVLIKTPPMGTLAKACSAFSMIWLMAHRMHDDHIGNLFNDNLAVKLDAWPAFEQIKHSFDDYRIASLLQKRSLNIQQVCQLLSLDKTLVSTFYQAMFLSGSCHIVNDGIKTADLSDRKPSVLSGLWRKMRGVVVGSV